jgi:hypothetical protein
LSEKRPRRRKEGESKEQIHGSITLISRVDKIKSIASVASFFRRRSFYFDAFQMRSSIVHCQNSSVKMSQTMSTTTSVLRRAIAAASRAPVAGSRMGLPACSKPASLKFYSTNTEASEPVQSTEEDHKKKSKSKATPRQSKADGIQLGYTIDTSAAPTLTEMVCTNVSLCKPARFITLIL